MVRRVRGTRGAPEPVRDGARFPAQLMHAAATLYYLEEATQAEIADRLGVSRPTVSRILAEARRLGVVRIEVEEQRGGDDDALEVQVAQALGLEGVHLGPVAPRGLIGEALAPRLHDALGAARLVAGDVLLVSSGRTVYEAAQAELPAQPGVVVVPTVGGAEEPEAWYQTNEITRQVAAKIGGVPVFLHAPALPSAGLHEQLLLDPSYGRVRDLWKQARGAVIGVGAPPRLRSSLPGFVPRDPALLRDAVGDVCSRFFDSVGAPVDFPGGDRLVATALETLREIPVTIGVAVGQEKVPAVIAAARAGYFRRLVTDSPTAAAIIDALEEP